ncbi:MAG: thiamine-monophosphate kinase [Phycisphaerae bacterium]
MNPATQPSNGQSRPPTPAKGERELIRRLAAQLPTDTTPVGFGHDVATLESCPGGLLWTVDMLMDGVDFESSKHRWYEIGRKAMAVNLSDCAAAATVPVAALCAVALSDRLSMDEALELFRGVRDCGAEFDCPVTGGDTNSWVHPTVICVTVATRPDAGCPPVTRSGARPGDRIYVTGQVGGSLLGRHLGPVPQIRIARAINRRLKPHAMIDISDGLAIDLWHICEASGCGATLDEAALDVATHPDALRLAKQTGKSPRQHALYDGEDFELIAVLSSSTSIESCRQLGLIPLGEITAECELRLRRPDGKHIPLEKGGWEHFRE